MQNLNYKQPKKQFFVTISRRAKESCTRDYGNKKSSHPLFYLVLVQQWKLKLSCFNFG